MSAHCPAFVALPVLILAAFACNVPPSTSTLPPQPSVEPTRPPLMGSISGKLCYPGSAIPPMTIYAVEQTTGKYFKLQTSRPDEASYRLDGVTPGTYLVYTWLDDGQLGGSYSEAVPCGLSADCTDHSLIPVKVNTGQAVTGIDVCDWYGPLPPAPPK